MSPEPPTARLSGMITLWLHPPVRLSAEDAEVLAGWLEAHGTVAAFAAARNLMGGVDLVDDDPQLALREEEFVAIRETLGDVEDLASRPDLVAVREWLDAR
jgi:hypothetical protein